MVLNIGKVKKLMEVTMKKSLKLLSALLVVCSVVVYSAPSHSTVTVSEPNLKKLQTQQIALLAAELELLEQIEKEQEETHEAIGKLPTLINLLSSVKSLIDALKALESAEANALAAVEDIDSGVAKKIEKFNEAIGENDISKAVSAILDLYTNPEKESFDDMNKRNAARGAWYSHKVAMQQSMAAVCRLNLKPDGIVQEIEQSSLITMTQKNREDLANEIRKVMLVTTSACELVQRSLVIQVEALKELERFVANTENDREQ